MSVEKWAEIDRALDEFGVDEAGVRDALARARELAALASADEGDVLAELLEGAPPRRPLSPAPVDDGPAAELPVASAEPAPSLGSELFDDEPSTDLVDASTLGAEGAAESAAGGLDLDELFDEAEPVSSGAGDLSDLFGDELAPEAGSAPLEGLVAFGDEGLDESTSVQGVPDEPTSTLGGPSEELDIFVDDDDVGAEGGSS